MKYIYSRLPKARYLAVMKQKFRSPLYVFDERLTGFVLGSFFAVAHYQPYEWNRKITSECNRAWGFVKEADGELEIRFLRGKGLLAPGWFLVWTLVCRTMWWFFEIAEGTDLPGSLSWSLCALMSLIVCGASAIESSLTEAGKAGAREIDRFLKDPEQYY